jgi:hypothetical protein
VYNKIIINIKRITDLIVLDSNLLIQSINGNNRRTTNWNPILPLSKLITELILPL